MSLPEVHKMQYRPWNFGEGPVENNYQTGLIDVFRDLSAYNSQHFPYTTSDGHALGAYVDVEIRSNIPLSGRFVSVQNSWKFRNSVRKFHFKREEMFELAGIEDDEIGTYARTIKPYFDKMDATLLFDGNDYWNRAQFMPYQVAEGLTSDEITYDNLKMGDWERTVVASSIPAQDGDVPETDVWFLHICDEHLENQTPNNNWDSVGMIMAYNQDKMQPQTPVALETVTGQNPLGLLAAQTLTGGVVTELAEYQELESPPYDISDNGDSISKSVIGEFRCVPYTSLGTNISVYHFKNLWLPAGYLGFAFDQSPISLLGELEIVVDVKAVWECRELA